MNSDLRAPLLSRDLEAQNDEAQLRALNRGAEIDGHNSDVDTDNEEVIMNNLLDPDTLGTIKWVNVEIAITSISILTMLPIYLICRCKEGYEPQLK